MSRRRGAAKLSRSEIMARVKGRDTTPELATRRALWAAGLRHRLQARDLPGRPDLVYRGRRTAVFVHGCFWHWHEGCPRARMPAANSAYWTAKIARNQARDREVAAKLAALGWRSLVIWECETRDPARLAALADAVRAGP